MMDKYIVFMTTAILSFTLWASPCLSAQEDPIKENNPGTVSGAPSQSLKIALNENETIMAQPAKSTYLSLDFADSYFVQAGGVLPISDDDFREFVDYGASITLGVKKQIMDKVSLVPTIGMLLLNGDWSMEERGREPILGGSGTYYPGYPDAAGAEDLPDENFGLGWSEGAEGHILSSELLQQVDLKTSIYILPVALNVVYRPHEGAKKINPYVGGGLGVCVAWREVESRTLKEKYYEGPNYRLTFNDNQTVTGQLIQFFGGIEIPFGGNMKFVADLSTTFYDLKRFKPILSISTNRPYPAWSDGQEPTTFSYEESLDIGVFREEWVSSASIGLVVPF